MPDDAAAGKQAKISQGDLPAVNLATARRVAEGLYDQFAGKSAAPHDLALALDISPTSSAWRVLTGAAVAYGLTQGAYNAQSISLTELGRRITAPTEEGDDHRALGEAALKPRVLREFFLKYDRAKFPRDDIAKNVLTSFGVPKDRVDRALEIVKDNGRLIGAIRDTKTGPFVALSTGGAASPPAAPEADTEDRDPNVGIVSGPAVDGHSAAAPPSNDGQPKQIFVAHGKNHKPLEDLKKILDQFKIPYKVAVDEPNVGRPISGKVAQLMRECSAGIFIFTGDEKFQDATGNEIYRPSENVVYELGAASVLWENKIIILKQKDVTFPSDYKDLGYIEFEENGLAVHALDLLKELIGLQFVRVQAA
jgi:predicted nucleotide-binding protein